MYGEAENENSEDKKKPPSNDEDIDFSNKSEDSSQTAKSMFANAVEVDNIDENMPNRPHHFDLAGLAHSLSNQATMSARITKLRNHLAEAQKALSTHEAHVQNITNLLTKADGEQKTQL